MNPRGREEERRKRPRRLTDVHLPEAARDEAAWPAGGGRMRRLRVAMQRRRNLRAIRRGLQLGQLELHYQPQIDLRSGRAYGVEALLRWRRDDELVSPGDFLPAAESSELIGPLTERVLEMGIEQAGRWRREGRDLRVAINLSPANLSDFQIVEQVEACLTKHDVDPSAIVLEVTETTVLASPERARAILDAISELEVAISVDDFGTGYSSLLWLQIFPVDQVKIDRSFVAQMEGDGRAFVEGVVRLAGDLDLQVVAEGIEDEPALRALQALGCDAGQGWLFAKAMPASEIDAWADAHIEADWARRETTVTIDPDFEQIAKARDVVAERATEAGLSEADIWDMRVAVTEALANAIEHGACASDNLIHVRITEEEGEFRLDIAGGGRISGEPQPPRSAERGRGISIMSGTTDSLKLTHERDENLIHLAKSLNGRAEAAERG